MYMERTGYVLLSKDRSSLANYELTSILFRMMGLTALPVRNAMSGSIVNALASRKMKQKRKTFISFAQTANDVLKKPNDQNFHH